MTQQQDRKQQEVWRQIRDAQESSAERIARLEKVTPTRIVFVYNTAPVINAVAFTGTTLSGVMRGVNNVADNARAIIGTMWIASIATSDREVWLYPSGQTPSTNGQKLVWLGGADTNRQLMSQFVMIPLGADGQFTITTTPAPVTLSLNIFGYML